MAQHIIGLDIGTWSAKAVTVESSLRRMSITGLKEQPFEIDEEGRRVDASIQGALTALLDKADTDVLTAGVPGNQVILRELELPFSDPKRVNPILGFQLDGQLPRPIDSMTYDWHVLDKREDGATLLCPAADTDWLSDWLDTVRLGGVEPRTLTLASLALENLTPHLDFGVAPGAAMLAIDIGHRTSDIALLQNGRIRATRTIARGGHQITQAIARALALPYAEAEHLKHTQLSLGDTPRPGVSEDTHRQLRAAALTGLEPLLRSLKVTADALSQRVLPTPSAPPASEEEATRLTPAMPGALGISGYHLSGGTALLSGLSPLLEQLLDAPPLTARPQGPIWQNLLQDTDAITSLLTHGLAALGLALEHFQSTGLHRANLRQGELSFASDFGALRSRLRGIGLFVAILIIAFFARKALQVSILQDHEAQLDAKLTELTTGLFGEDIAPDGDTVTRYQTVLNTLQSVPGADAGEVYPSMTAFRTFYELTAIQKRFNDEGAMGVEDPKERAQVELKSFAVDFRSAQQGAMTLTGITLNIVVIENFMTKLREHPCFDKVERQETRQSTNVKYPDWIDFTIKIEIQCNRV